MTTIEATAPEAISRCDACGTATAITRLGLSTSGSLDFCRHCLLKNTAGLYGKVKEVTLGPGAPEVMVTDAYVKGLLGVSA